MMGRISKLAIVAFIVMFIAPWAIVERAYRQGHLNDWLAHPERFNNGPLRGTPDGAWLETILAVQMALPLAMVVAALLVAGFGGDKKDQHLLWILAVVHAILFCSAWPTWFNTVEH